jgi:REP element-mobilizing transposase RayT
MANTYNQCYVQIVFAVKHRRALIHEKIRIEVEKYITGIIQQKNQKLLAIYCNPDHIHILISLDTKISIADLVRDIKANSSKFINENKLTKNDFRWQEGYGSFTYSKKEISSVALYIENQEEHHQKHSFKEEYNALLHEHEIKIEEKYLFEFIE